MDELEAAARNLWTWVLGGGIALILGILNIARQMASDRGTRDHVALEAARRGAAEHELAKAQQQVDQLTREVAELQQRLGEARTLEEFVEERGVLFKRRADGTYHDAVYCPKCRLPMRTIVNNLLHCGNCNWHAPIKSSDAVALRHGLSSR